MNVNSSKAGSKANIQKSSSVSKALPVIGASGSSGTGNDRMPNFSAGQIVKGEVVDLRKSEVSIKLQNSYVMNAKISDSMDLSIGLNATFKVSETNKKQITLKLIADPNFSTQDVLIDKALQAADLPYTDKNFKIIDSLLKNQMPVDKKTILKLLTQSHSNSNVSIETLVTMNRNNIPINGNSAYQFERYKNYEHSLLKDFELLSKNLPKLFAFVESSYSNCELVNKQLLDIVNEGTNKPLAILDVLDKLERENLVKDLEFFELPMADKENIINGTISSKKIFNLIETNVSLNNKEDFTKIFSSKEFQKIFTNELLNQWSLTPESIAKENEVENWYNRVYKNMEQINSLIQSMETKDEAVKNNVSNLKENIEFIKSLNEIFTYVQIPIKFKEQNIHSDLYVFTNKKSLNANKKDISVLLHLDMDNLGSIDIYLTMINTNINSKFYLNDDDSITIISENIEKLKEKLKDKGYILNSEFHKSSKDFDIVKDFVEKDSASTSFTRYSFDIRA